VTGEPFIWFTAVIPVCAVFFLLSLAWATFVVRRRQWQSGMFLLVTVPVWLLALATDFAHH
jgi:hypothetical protein